MIKTLFSSWLACTCRTRLVSIQWDVVKRQCIHQDTSFSLTGRPTLTTWWVWPLCKAIRPLSEVRVVVSMLSPYDKHWQGPIWAPDEDVVSPFTWRNAGLHISSLSENNQCAATGKCHRHHMARVYLQHAITETLLASPCTASTAVAGCPQVHSAHVAVDVQEQHPLYVIRQAQWLTITDDLSQQLINWLICTCASLSSCISQVGIRYISLQVRRPYSRLIFITQGLYEPVNQDSGEPIYQESGEPINQDSGESVNKD